MRKKFIGNLLLLISAILSLVISLHQTGWKITYGILGLEVWILIPYPVCWLLCRSLYKATSPKYSLIAAVFSILIFLFFAYAYSGLYIGRQSSTSGLIFLFAPLYMLLSSFLILGITNIVRIIKHSNNNVAA
jgi:hypothetical protein